MARGGGGASGARVLASLVATALALGVVLLAVGCTGDDAGMGPQETSHGGAGDLPGPLPQDVLFRKSPRGALAAPDFSLALIDGTSVTASDLWDDRPVVLVFTDSSCGECAAVHREVAEIVDEHAGAVALLALVLEEDLEGAREFAEDQQLGYPIALGSERLWLSYAAEEPPLVVLVGPGGKVLRGWPGGVDGSDLDAQLDKLYERSPSED
jgi:cytochrome c biogenesis protein CcmG/thiol:disulfide interchange protein DsbE